MRAWLRGRGALPGGIAGYPLDRLYEEVAFIAYHFHWPAGEIMDMEHPERQRWCEEISGINRRLSDHSGQKSILES